MANQPKPQPNSNRGNGRPDRPSKLKRKAARELARKNPALAARMKQDEKDAKKNK